MTEVPGPEAFDPFHISSDSGNLKRRAVHSSLVLGISQAVTVALQLASQIVLARLLFPRDYGLIAMVAPIIALIQVFSDLGFGQVIIQSPKLDQNRVSAIFWLNVAVSGGLAATAMLLAPLAAWFYGEPRIVNAIIALAFLMPIAALGIHPTALLTRRMKFGLLGTNTVAATLIGVTVTIIAAWLGMSYWSLILGQFFSTVTTITLVWLECRWRPSWPQHFKDAWSDIKFGGNVTGANLANYITMSADNIIIGVVNGEASLGLYDRSYRLVVLPITQLMAPIGRVALPLLCRLIDSPREYRAAYMQIVRALTFLTVPGMLACVLNGQVIVDVLLGPRWHGAGPIFSWICFGGVASAIYNSAVWLFISQGRTRDMRNALVLAAALNLISFIVGSFWGAIAVAALAALVFVLVTTPWVLFSATRSGPVVAPDMARMLAILALEVVMTYGLLQLQNVFFPQHALVQIVLAMLTAYSGFAMVVLAIPAERTAIRGMVRTVRGK